MEAAATGLVIGLLSLNSSSIEFRGRLTDDCKVTEIFPRPEDLRLRNSVTGPLPASLHMSLLQLYT